MPQQRKLAAVMFTDIIGYTALMSKDEQKALKLLQKNRDMQKSLAEKHNGEFLKEMGDGTLLCFQSALDAVRCAMEMQQSVKDDAGLNLRIGIHLGDIVFKEGDVFGDGVNVASRIERLAESGCICISEQIHLLVRNQPEIEAVFLEEKKLKNVDHPVKVYALASEGLPEVSVKTLQTEPVTQSGKKHLKRILPPMSIVCILVIGYFLISHILKIQNQSNGITGENKWQSSIAVLPFEDLSPNKEQEYFAAGMTDAIITRLSKIKSLRVISRTSILQYKDKNKPLPQIAKELDVNTIVEGTAMKAGDRIRITAQLIETKTDRHLWGDTYEKDFKDILNLQSEVSQIIAMKVKTTITPEEMTKLSDTHKINPDAHEAYLKGRFFITNWTDKVSLLKGIQYFERALRIQPAHAKAYTGLAEAYVNLAFNRLISPTESWLKAEQYVLKAMEIDDTIPEAHFLLAEIELQYHWNWESAERYMNQAVTLNPGYANAHTGYSGLLTCLGRHKEAIEEANIAQKLDPISTYVKWGLGVQLFFARRYDEAIIQYKEILDVHPDHINAREGLGSAYLGKKMYNKAISEFQKLLTTTNDSLMALPKLIRIYIKTGETKLARELMNVLIEMSKRTHVSSYAIAQSYASLQEKDLAFQWIEKAYEERDASMIILKVDPMLDNLHSDHRFNILIKRLGFK